jgi:hypothetical protein
MLAAIVLLQSQAKRAAIRATWAKALARPGLAQHFSLVFVLAQPAPEERMAAYSLLAPEVGGPAAACCGAAETGFRLACLAWQLVLAVGRRGRHS